MKLIIATLCMVVLPFTLMAQSNLITGTVISEDEGMPGVSVVEKGTTNGTVTDIDGKYNMELKSPTIFIDN
ncbi:MAG: carboxypeptidase-like regulatory domain-containing protein [Candidatus Symbiothrix sp.]|nr:carboxypeptidase-like regulatory domain-containing protein [Candidatus Symbiothrix sp.]